MSQKNEPAASSPKAEKFHDPSAHLSYGPSSYGGSPYYGADGSSGDFHGVSFQRVLRIVFRQWKVIVLVALIGFALGFLSLRMTTPLYRAVSEIEMSVRRPRIVQSDAVYEERSRDDVIINTRFAKFRSPPMEDLVVKNYLTKYPHQDVSERLLRQTIRSSVSWSKDNKANIVRVSVVSSDPEFAARLANTLSVSAGELMIRENQALSDGAVKWLQGQVEEQRTNIDKVEAESSHVRQEVQLDALTQRKEALGASLVALSTEYSNQQNQLAKAQTQCDFLKKFQEKTPNLETLPEGLPRQQLLSELIARWRAADEAFRSAAGRYTELHPAYTEAETRLQSARNQLAAFTQTLTQTLDNQIRLLKQQNEQVKARMNAVETESLELEKKLVQGQQQLSRLDRKHVVADNAYKALLKRMEEARLAADETMAFTKVLREASVPGRPFSPDPVRKLALALLFGLAAGIALACLIELWVDEISAVSELEGMGLSIVGVIPQQKETSSRGDLAVVGLRDKFSSMFELFAGFTAMLTSDRFRDQTRVLLINSAIPGEGKTICACNLAVSAALNGARTLLIDCDLRRPQLSKIFNIGEEHPSLLEWLSDDTHQLKYEELINRGVHKNLDLITSRPLHGVNPAELMGRGHIQDLILWARKNYDRVIIDSPPFGLAGDVQILANEVDSVLLVSRIGLSRRGALKHAVKRLKEMDVAILGVIANDVTLNFCSKISGGYHYSQYVSYGKY